MFVLWRCLDAQPARDLPPAQTQGLISRILQPGWMVQECPRHPEFFRQGGGQSPDPKCLGGVVAAVKNIQARILGQRVGPMRAFSGDKGVHPFPGRDFQLRPRPAGHDADSPAPGRTAGQKHGRTAQNFGQFCRKVPARNFLPRLPADEAAFFKKKRLEILEAERGAQLRVVAQARVGVQRQMRTVHGQIAFDQQRQHLAAPARPRHGRRPKQAVMDDEKIGPGRRRQLEGGEGGVHGGGDARDRAGVFHLQTVDRSLPVGKRFGTKDSLTIPHHISQIRFGHECIKTENGRIINARRKIFATPY
jgi:hypothetical protein